MSNPTEGQPTVYIFVRGGVVQDVRATAPVDVQIVDFDDTNGNFNAGGRDIPEGRYVKRVTGKSMSQIERETEDML